MLSNIASLKGFASLADAVSLNPQPLPPKSVSAIATSVLEKVALNPQPLPPKETASPQLIKWGVLDEVALNPQPLPPKDDDRLPLGRLLRSLDAVSLNPQPLPPKAVSLLDFDAAGPSRKMQMKADQQDLAVKRLENSASKDEDWQKSSTSHRDRMRDSILDLLRKMSEIKGTF